MADSKKAKRVSNEEIKKQLLHSMIIVENIEFKQRSWRNTRPWKSSRNNYKRYEDIIKTKNKGIKNIAFHQGQIFKRFKEKDKFAKLVSELGIHKTIIIFKINVFKLCKKYPKLLKSSIGLGFFKNYHNNLKANCEENEEEFQLFLRVFIF